MLSPTDALLAGPRGICRLLGWGVRRIAGDRFTLEHLTGINLDELNRSLDDMGEWFEELYPKDKP